MFNIYLDLNLTIGLIVGGIILVALIILVIILVKKNRNKLKIENNKKQNNEFIKIFGGEENIISCEAKGSRLILVLKDYSLLDESGLKNNGVNSMIKATNKVTLILGEKSKDLEQFIETNKRPTK